jgi:hypothetical protein
MAILTANDWFAAQRRVSLITKTGSVVSVAATPFSTLDVAGTPGAGTLAVGNTANGLVPTDAVAGFPSIPDFAGGATGYLASAKFYSSVAGRAILYDRIFHVGSISLLSLATTTLVTQPAYTGRLPGGAFTPDLEILLEINAAVSATATTVSVNYTNELGTAARTTGATASLSGFTTRRVIPMPLQAGDKSLQKIESVTVGGIVATTGTVNVIVARRLDEFDVRVANGSDIHSWDVGGAPTVFQDSALWLVTQPDATTSGVQSLNLNIVSG